MVCRGRAQDKAQFMAALANLDYNEPVRYDNKRMERALGLLLYFSAILPNKFLSVNKNDPIFYEILGFNSK